MFNWLPLRERKFLNLCEMLCAGILVSLERKCEAQPPFVSLLVAMPTPLSLSFQKQLPKIYVNICLVCFLSPPATHSLCTEVTSGFHSAIQRPILLGMAVSKVTRPSGCQNRMCFEILIHSASPRPWLLTSPLFSNSFLLWHIWHYFLLVCLFCLLIVILLLLVFFLILSINILSLKDLIYMLVLILIHLQIMIWIHKPCFEICINVY